MHKKISSIFEQYWNTEKQHYATWFLMTHKGSCWVFKYFLSKEIKII